MKIGTSKYNTSLLKYNYDGSFQHNTLLLTDCDSPMLIVHTLDDSDMSNHGESTICTQASCEWLQHNQKLEQQVLYYFVEV
jgi:hypothetical protein